MSLGPSFEMRRIAREDARERTFACDAPPGRGRASNYATLLRTRSRKTRERQVKGIAAMGGTTQTVDKNQVANSLVKSSGSTIGGLANSSGYISQFLPQATDLATTLLAGGNAQAQAPMVSGAYQQYRSQLNPYLQAGFLDPRSTPGFSDALAAANADITNQVNGMFAGAGRDLSGLNQQALARGLSQGEGQLIANQYNQNVANQLGAMGSLYGAGNTTAGLLSSLNQQALANRQAGLGVASTGQSFANMPYEQQLAAAA